MPVLLALLGACLLTYGTVLLSLEARLALSTIHGEMDFVWKLGRHYAPEGRTLESLARPGHIRRSRVSR